MIGEMTASRPLTLEEMHLKLYPHGLTIYCCPDDHPEQWFIMTNPAFDERSAYVFQVLAAGRTPADAFEAWRRLS